MNLVTIQLESGKAFCEAKAREKSISRPLSVASTAHGDQDAADHYTRARGKHRHAKQEKEAERTTTVFPGTRSSIKPIMSNPLQHVRFLHLRIADHLKTLLLVSLSLWTLPLSLALAFLLSTLPVAWIAWLLPFSTHTPAFADAYRRNSRAQPGFRAKTVLVTGINMTKGLTLARAFYLAGHHVVGADFDVLRSSFWLPQWLGGRQFSKAFGAVYNLERPVYKADMSPEAEYSVTETYVNALIRIMDDEDVDLWVSCSGVASAVEDGLVSSIMGRNHAGRSRQYVQFDEETTKKYHEKSSFIRHMQHLHLPVPETHEVTSRAQATEILLNSLRDNTGRRYILKPVGMDDAHRGNMTILPLSPQPGTETFPGQATDAYVHKLPISRDRPWILQQFIAGNREYCTHALVVDGDVKIFVACPSSDMLMHYEALPAEDPLAKAMLDFTKTVARAEKSAGVKSFTGHLSFDFMVERDAAHTGEEEIYAIECNPRAHTAVALFATPGEEMRAMVEAYMSVFRGKGPKPSHPEYEKWHLEQLRPRTVGGPPAGVRARYWIGHDLVALVLLPLLKLVVQPFSAREVVGSVAEFVRHVLFWREGVFEVWDPWPFVALYHHYWLVVLAEAWWRGQRWSRVNVSTTKMFVC